MNWSLVRTGLIAACTLLALGTQQAPAQELPRVAGLPTAELFDVSQWRNPQQAHGVTTYLRPTRVPNAVEALAVVRLAVTPEQLIAALTDVDSYCDWVANCMSSLRLATQTADRFSYVIQLALPPPFADRFSVVDASVHRRGADAFIIGVPDPRYPTYTIAGSRRMARADGAYRVRRIDARTVELSSYFAVNPGGGVPLWVTQAFTRQNAVASARGLRRHLGL